jgi:hypothetical protein
MLVQSFKHKVLVSFELCFSVLVELLFDEAVCGFEHIYVEEPAFPLDVYFLFLPVFGDSVLDYSL